MSDKPFRSAPKLSEVCRPRGFRSSDVRGSFSKVWQTSGHTSKLIFREIFWTRSRRGVIRGMHVQVAPSPGAKLVWVSEGRVTDVVVDLRQGSPTFGEWEACELSSDADSVLIPQGFAHGFEVHTEWATVNYAQECSYDPEADTGIRWDSFGFPWSADRPFVSERDASLPDLASFSAHVNR